MAHADIIHPLDPAFERFLYSFVGEDRNGSAVTVLSTLARLGLDPWTEAAKLSALEREPAVARLGVLLSRVRDVPGLGQDQGAVARKLASLLPERSACRESPSIATRPETAVAQGQPFSGWHIVTILVVLAVLAQVILGGLPWLGS